MALQIHLGHHTAGSRSGRHAGRAERTDRTPGAGGRVFAVQRLGALAVGLFLLAFGLLGFLRGLPVLSSAGGRVLGLSANGLLAGLSVVVAALLLGAAGRGPRVASTVMVALGTLFLLSALVNLALMETSANILAFQTSNVVFSVVVGLVLLMLGAYGRFSGHLPADSPYARPHAPADEPPDQPTTAAQVAAEQAMREAEVAVVEHRATEDQRSRVQAMAPARTRDARRRIWMASDEPSVPGRGRLAA